MPPSLIGVRAKRKRAEDHLKLVEDCINGFINSDPCPLVMQSYPERGIYEAYLGNPKELRARDLSLMIGDCVHNMRSAIDYIAWELAGRDVLDIYTMFPIKTSPTEFERAKHRIARVKSSEVRTKIERLQPYNTGNTALMAIENLDAADKHRLLTVTVPLTALVDFSCYMPAQVPPRRYENVLEHILGARLIANTLIARYTITPPAPDVQVKLKSTPQVAFGNTLGLPMNAFVVDNLRIMLDQVDRIIQEFTQFFTPSL